MPTPQTYDEDQTFADLIRRVSQTPSNTSLDSISQAGTGSGLFGITPDDTSGRMDSSYAKTTAGYDPFPGDHSKIDQLQSLYETVPGAFDVSNTLASLNKMRGTNLLTGEQAASTAAKRFSEAQLPGGQSGAASAMVRAQTLLPFLKQDQEAATEGGKYADTAKQGALSAAASIASSLAQLEQSYTNSLADYNSQKANFGLNYAQGQTNAALHASDTNTQSRLDIMKQQAQLQENARQANLAAALQTRQQDLQYSLTSQTATPASRSPAMKAPSGNYFTNNVGQVTSGNEFYNQYQEYLRSQR